MSDYPIIFSAPMVRALLDGRKTMTRRLANKPVRGPGICRPSPWQKVKPGDRLWVRENFCPDQWDADHDPNLGLPAGGMVYAADWTQGRPARKWTPSIHMPRKQSRLTLVVTATKIERLQDISDADAIAEGIWREDLPVAPLYHSGAVDKEGEKIIALRAVTCFRRLWEHLHGPESWDANPEVVAISFAVHRCNIDQMAKDAA